MSAATDPRRMLIDIDTLIEEIERYLAAVDAFRVAGCEPRWRCEPVLVQT